MNLCKSHKFFSLAVTLALTILPLTAQAAEELASVPSTTSELPFGQGDSLWMLGALGSPGNDLQSPSQHLELGIDLALAGSARWGPFYQLVSATKSENMSFPATGYSEKRESLVKATVIGLQTRWQYGETTYLRLAVGRSQTNMRVQSVTTDAPVPSTAVGLELKPPAGTSVQVAAQKFFDTKSGQLGGELGYNITSISSNDSFSELYLGVVIKFSIAKQASTPDIRPSTSSENNSNIPMPF